MLQAGGSKKRASAIDMEVGRRIQLERKARGLSQSRLAEALGVTFQQVQKYEKGVNRVGAGRLQQIAALFDVPIQTFFGGAAEHLAKREEPEVLAHLATPGALRLLRAYASANDPKFRNALIAIAEGFAAGVSSRRE